MGRNWGGWGDRSPRSLSLRSGFGAGFGPGFRFLAANSRAMDSGSPEPKASPDVGVEPFNHCEFFPGGFFPALGCLAGGGGSVRYSGGTS